MPKLAPTLIMLALVGGCAPAPAPEWDWVRGGRSAAEDPAVMTAALQAYIDCTNEDIQNGLEGEMQARWTLGLQFHAKTCMERHGFRQVYR